MIQIDYIRAYKASKNHKLELLAGEKCGCFCCTSIFYPSQIEECVNADLKCPKNAGEK